MSFDPLGSFNPQNQPGEGDDAIDPNEFGINFDGVEDWEEFKPLPNGTYRFRIFETKPRRSSQGNPMVDLVCKIDPNVHPEHNDRQVTDFLVLTQKAMPRVKTTLSAIMDRDLSNEVLAPGWWNEILGLPVDIVIEQRKYKDEAGNDKVTVDAKGYIPVSKSRLGGGGGQPQFSQSQARVPPQPQGTPAQQPAQTPGGIQL